ncbi:MAG: hypothetical protein U1E34_03530 [Amaricoccus sp.]
MAATGRAYALDGITTMRFRPDHQAVLERHVTADMLGPLTQIGALPPLA